jgi:hypothetical protein
VFLNFRFLFFFFFCSFVVASVGVASESRRRKIGRCVWKDHQNQRLGKYFECVAGDVGIDVILLGSGNVGLFKDSLTEEIKRRKKKQKKKRKKTKKSPTQTNFFFLVEYGKVF